MMDTRISSVRLIELSGTLPKDPSAGMAPQSLPVSVYDQFHGTTTGRPNKPGTASKTSLYLEIGTTKGVTGRYGPVDPEVIGGLREGGIARALLGLDPMATTYVWDLLQRSNRHSRHGARKIAISAVDNTLWDLRGKLLRAPVWQLLGGAGRTRVPAYASTLGTAHGPDEVERVASELLDEGFTAQKWFFADGPGQGIDGMERNVGLVERTRETVGNRSALMFDAFMSWDPAYARAWCRRVEHLRPDWLEEPFPPGALPSFSQLRSSTSIPLATGEHLYDRLDVLAFLQQGLVGVVQVDPEWCGGVTDLVRMCALAEPFGVAVIPHGHGLHAALHVVASQSPEVCPRVEYLFRSIPNRYHFELSPPSPKGGTFALPTADGFGIQLAEDRIERSVDIVSES